MHFCSLEKITEKISSPSLSGTGSCSRCSMQYKHGKITGIGELTQLIPHILKEKCALMLSVQHMKIREGKQFNKSEFLLSCSEFNRLKMSKATRQRCWARLCCIYPCIYAKHRKYQGLVKWCILSDQLRGFAVTHLPQVPVIHQLSSTQASHYNGEISSHLPDLSDFPLSVSSLFIAVCWTSWALSCPPLKSLFSWCWMNCKMWPRLQPELFYFAFFVAEAFPALKTHLYYHG